MNKKITVEDIKKQLEEEEYIASDEIVYALYTALVLNKPILVDGPAGVGKTELAKVMAKLLDTELIRMQCYDGIDAAKVLYDINYPKQLLYQNILKSKLDEILAEKDFHEAVEAIDRETSFYGEGFIIERPILKALAPKDGKKKTILLDEIDKTDAEAESLLLETLSDFTLSIPEFGTITCPDELRPFVILTSNNNRELSEALRRRCVYLHISYPTVELESKIIEKKAKVSVEFANAIAKTISNIRDRDLRQKPSIAESIEWATVLFHHLGITTENNLSDKSLELVLENSLHVLIKNQRDLDDVKGFIRGR